MNWNASNIETLRRVFTTGFTAGSIAESLVSFDASTSAAEVRGLMEAKDFDAVAVRQNGLVVGFVEREKLGEGACGQYLQGFAEGDLITDSTPLADVVLKLAASPRLFVKILGVVGGIVTMGDVQKPPVRMWLFGIITLLEMRVSRLIAVMCPGDSWKEYISEGRLAKAQTLLDERLRRNQGVELLDCLQISDKGQIIARNQEIRELTVVESQSRRQTEEVVKKLESLRNNLAHSQDIVASDWEIIVLLCGDLERVITGSEQVQRVLADN